MSRTWFLALSSVVAFFVVPGSARATTRYVQNIAGCCTKLATNPNCTGVSGTPPFCTIEDAVDDGDTTNGDTILVAPGTWQPAGSYLNVNKNLAIVSAGTDPPLTRALQTSIVATVSFNFGPAGPGRRIEGFTITSPNLNGAIDGIRLGPPAAVIVGNRITGNQGKGIVIMGHDSASPPTSSQITGNIVSNNGDTGISIAGADATIDCRTGVPAQTTTVSDNGLSSSDGSGIHLDGSNATITDCTISGNRGNPGGGIHITRTTNTPPVTVIVVNSMITGNHATVYDTANGGGVYANAQGTLWFVNTTIHDNDALWNGGGAFFQGAPADTAASPFLVVEMQNCLITCNKANAGAGIFAATGSLVEAVNSDLVFNTTVPGPDAQTGGGMRLLGASANVYNSIFWANRDNQAPYDNQFLLSGGSGVRIGWSIVEGWISSPGGFTVDGPVLASDPNFVDPTCTGALDLRLTRPSPAIDSGCNTRVLPDAADLDANRLDYGERTPWDLDEDPRFNDDPDTLDSLDPRCEQPCPVVDMGAYELQAPGEIVWDSDPLSPDRTTRSLRFRVACHPDASLGDAIRVELVELQHPDPRNAVATTALPTQTVPQNFSTFDTNSSQNPLLGNGICSGATASPNYNGHPCDPSKVPANADCLCNTPSCAFNDAAHNGACVGNPAPPLLACTTTGETAQVCLICRGKWVGDAKNISGSMVDEARRFGYTSTIASQPR